MSEILITGVTGRLGKELAKILSASGIEFKGLSRKAPSNPDEYQWVEGDLASGKGLDAALENVKTVFHLASNPNDTNLPSDSVTTAKLLEACRKAGVTHFIYISIVGTDKVDYPYYKEKTKTEEVVKSGGVPYTILRATQFHEFIEFLLSTYIKRKFSFIPKDAKYQPIETRAVAERLFEIYKTGPANGTLNIAGPEIFTMLELADKWMKAKDTGAFLIGKRAKGWIKELNEGFLTMSDAEKAGCTWQEYLDKKYSGA